VWVDLWLGAGACARQSRLHDASGVRAGWHGWATATLSDGDNSIEVTASYLTDALGDLSRAVIALLRGASNARVVWAEEPGEYHWVFDRLDDRVALRVLWFLNRASTVSDERGTTVQHRVPAQRSSRPTGKPTARAVGESRIPGLRGSVG
jgi:hypothetical protein